MISSFFRNKIAPAFSLATHFFGLNRKKKIKSADVPEKILLELSPLVINRRRELLKGLAGGATMPREGFRFAFENGADFICVGMFDFQVVNDVNTAIEILSDMKVRTRTWYS